MLCGARKRWHLPVATPATVDHYESVSPGCAIGQSAPHRVAPHRPASRVRAAFGRSSVNCGRPTSNEVSDARWMLGREFGRKAHPFLAGRAQVRREP